jgi:hypothetical protein
MAAARSWWRMRRVKHRDGVALCVLSSAFLLAGELATPVLLDIYSRYLEPVRGDPVQFVARAVLALLAFTTAFGAVLVLAGGWFFLVGRVSRGRFLVGLGVGFTSLTIASRVAYTILVSGSPLAFFLPLATTLSGIGVLVGVAAHTVMGQYALLLKRHALTVWRRWRRARRHSRTSRARA